MIELEEARDLLKRAVETQGRDFVYNPGGVKTCHYAPIPDAYPGDPRGKTGCLIGVALDLAGETRHHDATGQVSSLTYAFPDLLSRYARHYFNSAQVAQDAGDSWGEAYDHAEAYVSHLNLMARTNAVSETL